MIEVGLHSGGRFRLDAEVVDVTEVQLLDIAFGLAHVTRFGGQYGPFSVGEHSVNLCRWARRQYRHGYELRALLIHDAPECLGFGDFQRFVKRMIACEEYSRQDRKVTEALWAHFCPEAGPWSYYSAGVKNFDAAGGAVEAMNLGASYNPIDLPVFDKDPYEMRPRKAPADQVVAEWLKEWETAGV